MTVTEQARDDVTSRLLDRLPQLIDEVRDGLREHWPEYAEFLDHDREGVIEAAKLFAPRLLECTRPAGDRTLTKRQDEPLRLVFEQIGRRQMQQGADLTRLLTAFQYGSRMAWRYVSAVALSGDLAPDDLAVLADAVFGFVSNLSFAAARGYLFQQLDDAGARESAREELAALLLSGRASRPAVRAAAQRAGWRVPETAAVALVGPDDGLGRRVIDGLGSEALRIPGDVRCGAIIPETADAAGRLHLRRLLQGASAVVGSVVTLDRLPRSVEIAEIAARLCREGVIDGDPVFADEHLDTIMVRRDGLLLDVLRHQVLSPLDDLTEASRERLLETLTSWLRHQGNRMAMAEDLCVHPQTVRYRMAQLHELLGDQLDDPRSRARLLLALNWTQ